MAKAKTKATGAAAITRAEARDAYAAQRASARDALISARFARDEIAALIAAGRDVIALRTRPARVADNAIGATRLGGSPDLPARVAWPARDGYDFDFVGQLRLAELATLDIHDLLPHTGVLSLFAGHDVTPASEWQLAHRVEHYGDDLALAPVASPPRARHLRPPKPCGVELAPVYDLPPPWSAWLPAITHSARYADAFEARYQLSDEPVYPESGLLGFDRANEANLAPDERMLLRLHDGENIPYAFSESVTLCFVIGAGGLAAVRAFEGASI